jgi:hypothetical protein
MMESVTHKKAFLGLPSGGKYLLNYVFNLCRSLEISLVILIPNILSTYTTGTTMGHMKDSSTTQFFCAAVCVARWKLEPLGPASMQ